MSVFDVIALFGGLAMFLYGMRMMGDGLKESSSGMLRGVMKKVTGTPLKAFLLGLGMTAVIQSSTATIVITSGLVAAGILSLHQSLGIIIGANVGTTVTGQIIRLLDLNASGGASTVLRIFQPSTLAPLALIIGIVLIMGKLMKDGDKLGRIVIGFGILFTGLMNMTEAVSALTQSHLVEDLFSSLGRSPLLGWVIGLGVSFVLQSSSAAIGILQAFSMSGLLSFNAVWPVLTGIYMGDCVTTAIVCSIGAKADARRVGIVHILFNLSKTVLIIVGVLIVQKLGLLGSLWTDPVNSGTIANANTVFNLASALLMLPVVNLYEKLSLRIVKDVVTPEAELEHEALKALDVLNPVFFQTPALALDSSRDALSSMFHVSQDNIFRAFDLVAGYDEKQLEIIMAEEQVVDRMADRTGNYLVQLSEHLTDHDQVEAMDYYHAAVSEFERLGDHAENIAEAAEELKKQGLSFSQLALGELDVLRELVGNILHTTLMAFENCDADAARHIEPLEETVDDIVEALRQHHLDRLKQGLCSVPAGTGFLNILSEVERISDICSSMGVATICRVYTELKHATHDYVARLHAGEDAVYNREYREAHDRYFGKLSEIA